jgi:hypothetical protein
VRNHGPQIAAMDLFVAPTIGFDLLYALIIVHLDRRELVWVNVTAHPTAEWIARQITEAFPWNEAPRYLIRDRDGIYGSVVRRRLRAMGIRDKPISVGSPWQKAQSAGSALTTSWYSASSTCAGSCALMRCITMKRGHIVPEQGRAAIPRWRRTAWPRDVAAEAEAD